MSRSFLVKQRVKSGPKQYKRKITNKTSNSNNTNNSGARNINTKQGATSILINGKRYYRKLNITYFLTDYIKTPPKN